MFEPPRESPNGLRRLYGFPKPSGTGRNQVGRHPAARSCDYSPDREPHARRRVVCSSLGKPGWLKNVDAAGEMNPGVAGGN